MSYDPDNVFARILRREIPATLLHEDEHCIAFRDIAPQAPFHVLVVPRKAIARLGDANAADAPVLGHLLAVAAHLARAQGDRKSTRLNSSHVNPSRMPSSA